MRVPPTAGYLSVARLALLHAIAGPLGAASGFIWDASWVCPNIGTTVTTTMATATW